MTALLVFALGSALIIRVSWPSLRSPRSHGFFRFFAFESILGLVALNLRFWFDDSFSLQQIISWALLCASLFLVAHGFWLLRMIGKPSGQIEQTTALVTVGAYNYIRHPLYSSLLWLAWGAFLKHLSLFTGILLAAACLFLFLTARVEEKENLSKFGAEYAAYKSKTKMFVPFLF